MPYGPKYCDGTKHEKRGLIGLFFCASIEDQFEVVMSEWIEKKPMGPRNLGNSKDPLVGHHDDERVLSHSAGERALHQTQRLRAVRDDARNVVCVVPESLGAARHRADGVGRFAQGRNRVARSIRPAARHARETAPNQNPVQRRRRPTQRRTIASATS